MPSAHARQVIIATLVPVNAINYSTLDSDRQGDGHYPLSVGCRCITSTNSKRQLERRLEACKSNRKERSMLTKEDKEYIKQAIQESRTPENKEEERKKIMQITDRAERRRKIAEFMQNNGGSWI